jgi:hypothetical protein
MGRNDKRNTAPARSMEPERRLDGLDDSGPVKPNGAQRVWLCSETPEPWRLLQLADFMNFSDFGLRIFGTGCGPQASAFRQTGCADFFVFFACAIASGANAKARPAAINTANTARMQHASRLIVSCPSAGRSATVKA